MLMWWMCFTLLFLFLYCKKKKERRKRRKTATTAQNINMLFKHNKVQLFDIHWKRAMDSQLVPSGSDHFIAFQHKGIRFHEQKGK